MDNAATVVERPAWCSGAPDYEIDYEEVLASGAPPLTALMNALRLLRADEVLLLRISFQPALLYRALEMKGYRTYAQADEDEVRIYIRRA